MKLSRVSVKVYVACLALSEVGHHWFSILNFMRQVQGATALELSLSDKPILSVAYGKCFTKK